jgi:putative ABC transport system substrate-binding protein
MMRRREFITALGGAAAWPLAARAQQPAMPVIGYLSTRSPQTDATTVAGFRRGLNEAGYIEGRNVWVEFRWASGQFDRLPSMAEELVRRGIAVLVTAGGTSSSLAAKAATSTIPIVFAIGDDPVQFGLVASLNRPGGNLTGTTTFAGALAAKQLGLLRELAPNAGVIGILANPNEPAGESQIRDAETAARATGQPLVALKASTEREIDAALVHVPYRGEGLALTDLIGGQVQAMFGAMPSSIQHIRPVSSALLRSQVPSARMRCRNSQLLAISCRATKRAACSVSVRPRTHPERLLAS